MTETQFDALAQLLQLRNGRARDAARMVLVDGKRQADAARATGLSRSAVGNAIARGRRGLALARKL